MIQKVNLIITEDFKEKYDIQTEFYIEVLDNKEKNEINHPKYGVVEGTIRKTISILKEKYIKDKFYDEFLLLSKSINEPFKNNGCITFLKKENKISI